MSTASPNAAIPTCYVGGERNQTESVGDGQTFSYFRACQVPAQSVNPTRTSSGKDIIVLRTIGNDERAACQGGVVPVLTCNRAS